MDQKGYQRWNVLGLNEFVGLWGRYDLKQGNLLYFFQNTNPAIFLRSFLYSLTYCIKEVINGKIFWRLNLKVPAYEADTAWTRGIPCNFSQHWSHCICFLYFSIAFDASFLIKSVKNREIKKTNTTESVLWKIARDSSGSGRICLIGRHF